MFKKVLRTFEAGILIICKNIHKAESTNYPVLSDSFVLFHLFQYCTYFFIVTG